MLEVLFVLFYALVPLAAARATERYAGVLAGSAVSAGIVLLLGYLLPFRDAAG